jgi:L-iditol 2-dehydrogenase
VGGAALLESAIALTRHAGAIVLFAHARTGERAGFDLNALFKHERRILSSYSGARQEQSRIFSLMLSGALDPSPLVSHHLALADFASGLALARRHEALKILFTP